MFYRYSEAVKRDAFKTSVMYGEMSTVPLDQLTAMVDKVRMCTCLFWVCCGSICVILYVWRSDTNINTLHTYTYVHKCINITMHSLLHFITFKSSQVMLPLITNDQNHFQWPGVVSQDVVKHTGGLKGDVLVLSGQVKGRTLLPLPPQAETATEAVEKGWENNLLCALFSFALLCE